MGRFRAGWTLGLRCWGLPRNDRELLRLPILAGLSSVALVLIIGVPAATARTGTAHPAPLSWVLYALLVVAVSVVSTFFGAALVAGALQRLSGQPTSLSHALATA